MKCKREMFERLMSQRQDTWRIMQEQRARTWTLRNSYRQQHPIALRQAPTPKLSLNYPMECSVQD
eukprot:1143046-Pelagomonas_calceolata.AAC.5